MPFKMARAQFTEASKPLATAINNVVLLEYENSAVRVMINRYSDPLSS